MARSRGVYNRTFTPELWEKVNPQNKAILDDFIAEYRQRKKAKGTIDGYFQDLRIILIHILENYNNKSKLYCKDKSEDMIDDMFGFNKVKENVGEV